MPIELRIGERVPVARQQQMIAVVDGEIGRGIEIGAAAAAGLLRRLVDMDAKPAFASRTAAAGPDTPAPMIWTVFHQMNA